MTWTNHSNNLFVITECSFVSRIIQCLAIRQERHFTGENYLVWLFAILTWLKQVSNMKSRDTSFIISGILCFWGNERHQPQRRGRLLLAFFVGVILPLSRTIPALTKQYWPLLFASHCYVVCFNKFFMHAYVLCLMVIY
jgi:hypothetical protein